MDKMSKIIVVANTQENILGLRKDLITFLEKEGLDVCVIPDYDERQYKSIIRHSKFFIKCFVSTREKGIVVFSFTPYGNFILGLLNKLNNFKWYPTVTGQGTLFLSKRLKHKLAYKLLMVLYKSSNKIFFHNNNDKEYFINKHILTPDKAIVVPGSGIDLHKFSKKHFIEPKTDELSIVTVARLIKEKGIEELILAAEILEKTDPNIKFTLIGRYDKAHPRAISKQHFAKMATLKNFQYRGQLTDIQKELKLHDVYLLPSYREGMSRSLIEALACGLPVITTNAPGCIEAVPKNKNGILIDPRSHSEILRAIKMMKNQDLKQLGAESRKVAQAFDLESANKPYLLEINNGKDTFSY